MRWQCAARLYREIEDGCVVYTFIIETNEGIQNELLCDAAGFKDYLYLLSSLYTGVEKGPDYRPISRMGKQNLFQVVKNFSWLDRIKIFTRKNDLTKPDTAKFDFEGDLNHPFTELKTVPREKVRLLKDYAKLRGATVNDVLLTAYIRTLYQYFGRVVAVPRVVDLRKYPPNRKAGSISISHGEGS